jgi:hypothetical protein
MGVKQIRETTKVMTRQMRDARSTVSSDIDIDIDIEAAAVDTMKITGSASNANAQSLCLFLTRQKRSCVAGKITNSHDSEM